LAPFMTGYWARCDGRVMADVMILWADVMVV